MASQRPGGVVLIAVLAWISSVLQIVSGALVVSGVVAPDGVTTETAWVALVVGTVTFLVAFALFGGSNVARVLVTISFVLSLISAILSILADPTNLITPLLAAIIALIGLALLYTRRANDYFGT